MRKNIYSVFIGIVGLLLSAGIANTTLIIGIGHSPGDVQNILFNDAALYTNLPPATTVDGHTNRDKDIVEFTGNLIDPPASVPPTTSVPVVITTNPGAARVEKYEDVFNSLSFELQGGGTFDAVEFNINPSSDGMVQFSFDIAGLTSPIVSIPYAVGDTGVNRFYAWEDGLGDIELMARVTILGVSDLGFDDFRQIKIGPSGQTPIPEPATMLLFGVGLAGLAGTRLSRKK